MRILMYIFQGLGLTLRIYEGKLREFFSIARVKEMAQVCLKKRDNFKREIVLLMFVSAIVSSLSSGEGSITFLYLRKHFGWTLKQYTLYGSVSGMISMVGVGLGIYVLHKMMKVTESVLVVMGMISGLDGALLMGMATSDFHIYLAGAVKCTHGVAGPMARSLLSKLVSSEEIGKIFSLTMVFNFIFGMVSTPMYNLLYKDTLDTNPAVYNFLTAGFHVANILVIGGVMAFEFVNFRKYQTLENETQEEEVENNNYE